MQLLPQTEKAQSITPQTTKYLARLIDNEGELVIEMKVNIGSDKGVIVEVIPDIRYQQFKDRKKWPQAGDYCQHGNKGLEAEEEGFQAYSFPSRRLYFGLPSRLLQTVPAQSVEKSTKMTPQMKERRK